MQRVAVVCLVLLLTLAGLFTCHLALARTATREEAVKQMGSGFSRDALAIFQRLALDPKDDPEKVNADLVNALNCLQRLNREDELDVFREKVIAAHAGNWRLLATAGQSLLDSPHYGYLISGVFKRGEHRGGGNMVDAQDRDRVRALQLLLQAHTLAAGHAKLEELAELDETMAQALIDARAGNAAWRLQGKTDLTKLPDVVEGYQNDYSTRGTPVDDAGNPVYFTLPASWDAARNDGERWRWVLARMAAASPDFAARADYTLGAMCYDLYGETTLRDFAPRLLQADEPNDGPFSLRTLPDTETVARLATGVKRFILPDDANFIKHFQAAATEKSPLRDQALQALAEVCENRQQYDRAAELWKQTSSKERAEMILGNWGRFESAPTQSAGKGATVEYTYRNGHRVTFTASPIDVQKLLADMKAYVNSHPKELDGSKIDLSDIGQRLVRGNEKGYVGKPVATWEQALTPKPYHFNTRTTIATPLKSGGAYLLDAKMADGNTCHIVIWLADLAIVKKPGDKGTIYFVADAATGTPVPNATMDFFGFYNQYVDDPGKHSGHNVVHTKAFTKTTDADGLLVVPGNEMDGNDFRWVITATDKDRLAFLGFPNYWYENAYRYDDAYETLKRYGITDRPVYRPGQTVKLKAWMSTTKYDQEGDNPYAGQAEMLEVYSPRNEKLLSKEVTLDTYGGATAEVTLPVDAALGEYYIALDGSNAGYFRVEEYKKPEFEVTIEAPTKPVALGEKITAVIKAKYYFGAPVTHAKVKYKIERTDYHADWYPADPWNWFYGPGYWWFCGDYDWYPGWHSWGRVRPQPLWERGGSAAPELVAQAETTLDTDGTAKVEIDTAVAKALYGDTDHRYAISVEVTDKSRRTITGDGAVLVARKPFQVSAWVDRGYYRVGDTVQAQFSASTLDNHPVPGAGTVRLYKISYPENEGTPVETEVQTWPLTTDAQGQARQPLVADEAGQYRVSYSLTDADGHTGEGGYLFSVMGDGTTGTQYRFNALELLPDKKTYQPGESVKLLVGTNRRASTVLLFARPSNGIYLPPRVLHLTGRSTLEAIEVAKKDMPNFFIEAVTVSDGKVHTEVREIAVPPEQRILNVDVHAAAAKVKPGEKAVLTVKVTDFNGNPYRGSTVVSLYDKSLEYISGGSNVPDIRAYFWQWRREHHPNSEDNLQVAEYNQVAGSEEWMRDLGDNYPLRWGLVGGYRVGYEGTLLCCDSCASVTFSAHAAVAPRVEALTAYSVVTAADEVYAPSLARVPFVGGTPPAAPVIRRNFADTAYWTGALTTDAQGEATVTVTMPDNLTTWKARVWAMGLGARVGEGSAEVITTKNLLLRMEAPRFFVQHDHAVFSGIVHNYLPTKQHVQMALELDGKCAELDGTAPAAQFVDVEPNGEQRVDWPVRLTQPGTLTARMKALAPEESDAMEMSYPVYVHGMLKTESFSGVIRPEATRGAITYRVPAARLPAQSRLEVRYSPTLAGAMVDALPYLLDYPYGCTEQTLNRFLPAALTQHTLQQMGVSLRDIRDKRSNLNAQEIGDDKTRAADWSREGTLDPFVERHNPVFDEATMRAMVRAGVERLGSMECADGGWGWFSGYGEQSYPHTTALVVHGLQVARDNGMTVEHALLEGGVGWLRRYQREQVRLLSLPVKNPSRKWEVDADDAFIYMVLADSGLDNPAMRTFLYRDRVKLPVYGACMYALGLHRVGDTVKRDAVIRLIDQFLVEDDEDQTAYLKLPENNWWWCWYGSEYEAQAYYLKLLTLTDPHGKRAPELVKYLLNNRKHATYWESTRDTAIVVEAFADFLKASGEMTPKMTLDLQLDGKTVKTVMIDKGNLFSFDNALVLTGDQVTTGAHTVTLTRRGSGPVYFNAYLSNFTLEDPITKAGLEIKVERAYYKLVRANATADVQGSHGQVVSQQVEKFTRVPLANLDTVKSGDLLEVELSIASKNDYEYILFEDMKAAGCEPVEVQSGYNGNEMDAYVEYHDERVCFFVRRLARGTHSLTYRLRAETPGTFSALPTKASALYAPELKANADEQKLHVED